VRDLVGLPALRAFANIVGGPDHTWTERVVGQPEVVPTLLHLLTRCTDHRAIIKEVGIVATAGILHGALINNVITKSLFLPLYPFPSRCVCYSFPHESHSRLCGRYRILPYLPQP